MAIEIGGLPIRETWNRLHSGLGIDTFRDLALSYTNMVALSHETDFALGAEIQNDPMMMIPPAPDMPSYDELGGYFPITQRTQTGWNTGCSSPRSTAGRPGDEPRNPARQGPRGRPRRCQGETAVITVNPLIRADCLAMGRRPVRTVGHLERAQGHVTAGSITGQRNVP